MSLWHKDKLIEKAKTDTVNNTQNPVFNNTGLVFFDLSDLNEEGLKNIKLEFKVKDEDLVKDDVIGRLVIGGENCVGTGLQHWNQIISSPLQEIEMWHPLCDLGAITTKITIKSDNQGSLESDMDKTLPSDEVPTHIFIYLHHI